MGLLNKVLLPCVFPGNPVPNALPFGFTTTPGTALIAVVCGPNVVDWVSGVQNLFKTDAGDVFQIVAGTTPQDPGGGGFGASHCGIFPGASIFWVPSGVGGATQISRILSNFNFNIWIYEVSGISGIAARGYAEDANLAALNGVSPTINGGASAFYVAGCVCGEVGSTVNAPWTLDTTDAPPFAMCFGDEFDYMSAYQIGSGPQTATFSRPNPHGWAVAIAAFSLAAPAVPGTSFPSSEVVAAPTDACGTDPRIASRQFLFGLPGKLVPFSQANIYSINRRTGLRGDGSTGGVLTILYSGTLAGDLSEVLIQDAPDESVNGLFSLPTTAAWGSDGVHSLLQFKQDGPDLTVFGGLISSLTGMLSVAMTVPDVQDDDGIGFDTTYQPWFAQLDMKTLRFGGYRGQLEGAGKINVTPVAEDSTLQFQTLSLEMHSGTVQFEGGMLFDGSYCSTRISNGARAGSWFSVKLHKLYAALLFEAQP